MLRSIQGTYMNKLLPPLLLVILSIAVVIFFNKYWGDDFSVQFSANIAGTILGGIFLTFIYFYLREYIFPFPDVSGVWEAKEITENSGLSSYKGMAVVYKVVLLQDGSKFFGSGERDRENSAKKSAMEYSGSGRVRITIEGFIDKKYLSSSVVRMHWIEEGKRETSTVHRLLISGSNSDCNLKGTFYKTAANSSGSAIWTRISE